MPDNQDQIKPRHEIGSSENVARAQFEAFALSPEFGLRAGHLEKDENGEYLNYPTQCYWQVWQASHPAAQSNGWQGIDTCPQHAEVLFYRADAGVFTGMITDADHFFRTDKERDDWPGTEEEMFALDAFGFGDFGVCRCDGSERPTHWMPLPAEPEVKP